MERSGKISDRCRTGRDIRERNRLREQIRQTAREITEFILKKAGDFIERFRHLIGPVDDIRETGAASVYSRRTAERDRGIREREQRSEQRKRKSAETDRHIAETDRRIKELAELKQRKEAGNNDRIRKLMERRRSHQDHGGTADGTGRIREADRFPFHADTGTVLGQLQNAESDTEAFYENSELKSSLQQKSDEIVNLNGQIENLSDSDRQLKEAEDKLNQCQQLGQKLEQKEKDIKSREDTADKRIMEYNKMIDAAEKDSHAPIRKRAWETPCGVSGEKAPAVRACGMDHLFTLIRYGAFCYPAESILGRSDSIF